MALSEEKVHKIYTKFKKKAEKAYTHCRYNLSMRYIEVVAQCGYNFYLGYKDDDLEKLLFELSRKLERKDFSNDRNIDICVFYDSFSYDNGGLVHQYLRAIMSYGLKIYYISECVNFMERESSIRNLLEDYGKAEITVIPRKITHIAHAQLVYNLIADSYASRVFIHTGPSAVAACTAFYALPTSVKKYKVNLTDHTFWIGTRFIDYSFEFRPFGCTLSAYHRGIDKNKILLLPYYPIINNAEFEGFPKETDGKLILFSGGNYYKIFGKEDVFFKMSKAILDACPEVVMLYAGFGDSNILNDKLDEYQLKGRFVPIGERNDITEVFKHCDIYMNTYPIGGGMMLLYAAHLARPIVCYRSETTAGAEDIVCQTKYVHISDDDIPSIVNKVHRLVNDAEYRKYYGKDIQSCVVNSEQFNKLFVNYLEGGANLLDYEEDHNLIRHTKDIEDKLVFENKNKVFQRSVSKIIGIPALWICPIFVFNSIVAVTKENRLLKAIKNQF